MNSQGPYLSRFGSQIDYAIEAFKAQAPEINTSDIQHVVIVGLGGSGIVGQIMKSMFGPRLEWPMEVISDYSLPSYVNERTLLICSSYSGNTEETLSCLREGIKRGSQIICVTTGGEMSKIASSADLPILRAESGFQPRFALGYSLTHLCMLFGGILGLNIENELRELAKECSNTEWAIEEAQKLHEQLIRPISRFHLISDRANLAFATRFQQQLNENAKIQCYVHPMPEMCHNVIETLTGDKNQDQYVLLNSGLNERNTLRFGFIGGLLKEKGYEHLSISLNASELTDLVRWTFIFDWWSLLVADEFSVNSSLIPNIDALKVHLKG